MAWQQMTGGGGESGDAYTFWMNELGETRMDDPNALSPQDEALQRALATFNATPGSLDAKIAAAAQEGIGTAGILENLEAFGITPHEFYNSGPGIAFSQAAADDSFGIDDLVKLAGAVTAGTAGFGVGGLTGGLAASGNIDNSEDLQRALFGDAAGLAAAPLLASALPALGLSTVGPLPSVATAPVHAIAPTTAGGFPAAGGMTAEQIAAAGAFDGLGATGAAGSAGGTLGGTLLADAAGVGGTLTDATALAEPIFEGVPAWGAEQTAAALGAESAASGATVPGLASALGSSMPAAVPETSATLVNSGLAEVSPGVFTAPAPTVLSGASGAGSVLSNLTGLDPNLVQLLGTAGVIGAGVAGGEQLADAFNSIGAQQAGLQQQWMNFGAPYRDLLQTYTNDPNAFITSPGVQASVNQGTDALARALSVNGNPVGSGTALHSLQNYATNNLWNQYGAERDRLAGMGGLTQYASGATSGNNIGPQMAGANAGQGGYGALGWGLSQLTQPRRNNLMGVLSLA